MSCLFLIFVFLTSFVAGFNDTSDNTQNSLQKDVFMINTICFIGTKKYMKMNRKVLKKSEQMHMKKYFYLKFIAGVFRACLDNLMNPETFNKLKANEDQITMKKLNLPFFLEYDLEQAVFVEDYKLNEPEKRAYKLYIQTKKIINNFRLKETQKEDWRNLTDTKKMIEEQEKKAKNNGKTFSMNENENPRDYITRLNRAIDKLEKEREERIADGKINSSSANVHDHQDFSEIMNFGYMSLVTLGVCLAGRLIVERIVWTN